ncbi:hypothetical protein EP331_05295 [bacterium]|nr:MAG: hypothetical protein EP331_05295 [bacterium]
MKFTEKKENVYLETPQGFFLPKSGWIRVRSSELDKTFPGLFKIWSKEKAFEIVETWSDAEVALSGYLALVSLLVAPFWVSFLVFLILIYLMLTKRNLLYGLGLNGLMNLMNLQWGQVILSILTITFLGRNGMYLNLIISVVWFFLIRIGTLKSAVNWLAGTVFKLEHRHEKFLYWVCMKEAIKLDIPVKAIEEMKIGIQKAMKK